MQREHQESEYTTRETARQVGVRQKEESDSEERRCNTRQICGSRQLDLAETAKHLAKRMSELSEFDFIQLKRAARYQVGKPRNTLRFRRQEHLRKITVFVESDFAGDPVLRKSTTGLVAQIGKHTVKSGSILQSLTALTAGETEFHAVVKGGQVGLSLRSIHSDLGILMKVEIQSDSSTANSLTDRFRAGPRTKHTDTRYFWIQERVQDGDLSIKKVLASKNCVDVGTMPFSAFVLQRHCKCAGLVFY